MSELKPCPFCGDPMELHYDVLRHREQGDCPIGAYAWGDSAIAAWNRRPASSISPSEGRRPLDVSYMGNGAHIGAGPQPNAGNGEVVAWSYELATRILGAVTGIDGYAGFEKRVNFYRPEVPDGAVRNLTPLYGHPPRPETVTDEMVERILVVLNAAHPLVLDFDAESGGYYDTDLSREISAITAALTQENANG